MKDAEVEIKSQEIIDEVMSPMPALSPLKSNCEGPYMTNKI